MREEKLTKNDVFLHEASFRFASCAEVQVPFSALEIRAKVFVVVVLVLSEAERRKITKEENFILDFPMKNNFMIQKKIYK